MNRLITGKLAKLCLSFHHIESHEHTSCSALRVTYGAEFLKLGTNKEALTQLHTDQNKQQLPIHPVMPITAGKKTHAFSHESK